MRRNVISGIIAIAAIGIGSFYLTRRVVASSSTSLKPFTATLHELRFRADGSAAHDESYVVAFRADGSTVTDHHHMLADGQIVETKTIADVSDGRWAAVDYATESTSTYPLPSNYATMVARQMSCADTGQSGQTNILGYEVVLVHAGHTYDNGMRNVHDRWEAPALNCFTLRSIDFATRQPGVKGPHNETEAVRITIGEPDPGLFQIPQNFVERSPSERHAEFQRRFGENAPTPPEADQYYFSSRQNLK